ncbi:MAG TPA: nitroreductase/quinone reductase family protein, partial [Anaerolineales bacterium]|nr:nitroreductase/quinone reductase family protein [Anaerolineales bacterium]
LAGGKYESDWVKNLLKKPSVAVRIAQHNFKGIARIIREQNEEMMARTALAEKYQEWDEGRTLSQWARTALPVAIDIHSKK